MLLSRAKNYKNISLVVSDVYDVKMAKWPTEGKECEIIDVVRSNCGDTIEGDVLGG